MTATEKFDDAVSRGDAVVALMAAPFGYRSEHDGTVFRFKITSGPLARNVGEGRELIDAIRGALSVSTPVSQETGTP